ncbi:PEGA domain-containing protein [bacterium]|nr:PEGA domain-containing protein [bacterium]
MEKKKLLIIVLIVSLAIVLATITVPTIMKRLKRGSSVTSQPVESSFPQSEDVSNPSMGERQSTQKSPSDASIETTDGTITETAGALSEEGKVVSEEAAANTEEAMWMRAFLNANRTWGRSPFLRKGEGMGKILIMSSPSAADIYLDGLKMPNQTNWLTPLTLPAKKYILEIKKDGYYPYRQELVVTAGIEEFRDVNTINVTLEKMPIDAEEVAGEIWRQLKRPAIYVSMIVFDEEKPSALITEYDPESPPPVGEALSNRVVFEGERFSLAGSSEESKRIFLVKNIFRDHVVVEDTLVNWDYKLEIYKEAK